MNPIPLSAPDGRVYAYACGVCHHLPTVDAFMVQRPDVKYDWQTERTERYRSDAQDCCACKRCGAQLPEMRWGVCPACQPAEDAEQATRDATWAAKAEADEAAVVASLAVALDVEAARALVHEMRELSEEHYCAGWMCGLEFSLWAMLQDGARDYGSGEVTERDVEHLRALSQKAGGWWRWSDAGEVFVATAEWERIYAEHVGS